MTEMKSLTLNGKKYDCFVDPVARKSGGGVAKIEVLDSDPIGEDLTEGRIWILKTSAENLTIPVIELGTVGEKNIEIKLSNASFDGSGAVVTTYRIYLNGSYVKSETIAAGGTCTISGLNKGDTYRVSVRGVKDGAISAWSNTLTTTTAGEPDAPAEPMAGIVWVAGAYISVTGGNLYLYGGEDGKDRGAGLFLTGEKSVNNTADSNVYYPIPVPADATSIVVNCPGMMYGFSGLNLSDSNAYSYDVDGGWKASGVATEFDAGEVEYATIGLKRVDNGNVTESDVANITVTFV